MLRTICGMSVKNTYKGPAALLADVEDDDGNQNIALVFEDQYHKHPLLNDSLVGVIPFLENPIIPGIANLLYHEKGAFVFNTGPCLSIASLIRRMKDAGITPGPRAGLEFMERSAHILVDTSEYTLNAYAVGSHGSLNPWRMLTRRDGSIQVIGYAIPQVEMRDFHSDPQNVPREDSFRYCPPERISNRPEDVGSDLFVLALIAFEIMVCKPIYDGTVDEIRQKAIRGEVDRQLFQYAQQIPKPVREFLSKVLKDNPMQRYRSLSAFWSDLEGLLRHPQLPGMSFNAVVQQVDQMPKRIYGPKLVEVETSTTIFGKDQMLNKHGLQDDQVAAREDFVIPSPNHNPKKEIDMSSNKKTESKNPLWSKIQSSGTPKKTASKPQKTTNPKRGNSTSNKKEDTFRMLSESLSSNEKVDTTDLLKMLSNSKSKKNIPTFGDDEDPPPPPEFADDSVEMELSAQQSFGDRFPPDFNNMLHPPEKPPLPSFDSPNHGRKSPINPKKEASENTQQREEVAGDIKRKSFMQNHIEVPSPFSQQPQNPFSGPLLTFPPFTEKDEIQSYSLQVDTQHIQFSASAHSPNSNVLGVSLIGRRIPIRMDPMGKISAWYRFAKEDGFYPGFLPMANLPQKNLQLAVVPNRMCWVEIWVPDQGVKVMTSVGSAIPMLSIVDHLVSWLALEGKDWLIMVNDKEANYYDILEDFSTESIYTIGLQKK